jgi:hypothetical protein
MKKLLPPKRILLLLPLFVLLMAALCFPNKFSTQSSVVRAQSGSVPAVQTSSADLQILNELTSRLMTIAREMQVSDYGDRQILDKDLRAVAAVRRDLLLSLMRQNVGVFLQVSLPNSVFANIGVLPASLFEKEVQLDGELEVLYEDYETEARLRHFLWSSHRRVDTPNSGWKRLTRSRLPAPF